MLRSLFLPAIFWLIFFVPEVNGQETPSIKQDTSYLLVIKNIEIKGNKTTKSYIITRELSFHIGDSMTNGQLQKSFERSRQNLLNTSLFNFATIDTVKKKVEVNVIINLVERWYTWPVPIFEIQERNFNTWWQTKNLSRANYGFYLIRENFRGKKESLVLKLRLGYSEQYGMAYQVPYLNKKQNSGLGFSIAYTRNHEVAINTLNNQLVYFKDEKEYVKRDLSVKLNYTYRRGFYNTHTLESRYSKGEIADTIIKLSSDYFVKQRSKMDYLSLSYFFRRDFRDSKAYPLKGYYFDLELTKLGLGILPRDNIDITYIVAGLKNYWQLSNRFYLATGLTGKLSSKSFQPYALQRALGYRDYVRSYELYVIDGQDFGLVKTSLKYELIKPKISKLPLIKNEKFSAFHYAVYLEGFSDMGYTHDRINDKNNFLNNSILFGNGGGVNFVTYYDTILRIEYSFNRLGESGLFIHFSAPI